MTQKYIIVDVEADGPCPGLFSMVCFGAVLVDSAANKANSWRTFYGQVKPLEGAKWRQEALEVSGFNRTDHEKFDDPTIVMAEFYTWLMNCAHTSKLVFVSDNLAFDWQFINYYFHKFLGTNPFGHSGRRIGDLYCGLKANLSANAEWKRKYRRTRHTHNPVDDAIGNAEALITILENNQVVLGGTLI